MDVLVPPPSVPSTERALLLLSHAMERASDAVPPADDQPGVGAVAGPVDGLPSDVHVVPLRRDDPGARNWVLATVRGECATALGEARDQFLLLVRPTERAAAAPVTRAS